MTENDIKGILSLINEPFIGKDFTSLGFVKQISYNGKNLSVLLEISDEDFAGANDLKARITSDIQKAFPELKEINISFKTAILNHDSRQKEFVMPGVKNTIAVASGKGGVGKSTVAVNLAMALTKLGLKVGMIDADIYGPSIPLMMGIHTSPGIAEEKGRKVLVPVEQYGIKLMSIGFLMKKDDAVVWRGPMASSALKQFMEDCLWGNLDVLLFDMPPGTGDIQLTLSQTVPLTGAVVVTTPQEIATADARKGYAMFDKVNVPTLGVIENMSYYKSETGKIDYIFGQGGGKRMCEEIGVELLGEIPINSKIREQGDAGNPIVNSNPEEEESQTFKNIAKNLIVSINKRNSSGKQSKGPEIIMEG